MCEFDKSICGCSLKTGSTIIGYLSLFGSAFSLILSAVALGLFGHADTSQIPADEVTLFKTLLWIEVVTAAIVFLASISLLYGIFKEHPGYMLPWIVLKAISIVLLLILVVVQILSTGMASRFVGTIISELISIYLMFVVINHYREVKGGGSLNHA